jgi:hypothetical protein
MPRILTVPPDAAGRTVADFLRVRGYRMFSNHAGSDALLEIEIDEGIIQLLVAYPLIAGIQNEVDAAAANMTMRLRFLNPDRGADSLAAIASAGLRPEVPACRVFIEPATGDSIYILQFRDHAPLSIRLTQREVQQMRRLQEQSRAMLLN